MIIYPAIDLKDGQCVRLVRGKMDKATIFSDNPTAQAKSFENQGAEYIHIVDLNGAFEGKPVNHQAVLSIINEINIPVQLGGGIRTMAMIEEWLKAGVSRVILGTIALRNPDLVREACKKFPNQIIVGIDARGGKVAVEGWAEISEIDALDMAKRFEDAGVAAIIYTNIDKDGALEGADIEGTKELAEKISIPIIASGGVSNLDDLRKLKEIEKFGVSGVISGRAIYDGRFKLKDAIEVLK